MNFFNRLMLPLGLQVNKISSLALDKNDQDRIIGYYKKLADVLLQHPSPLNNNISGIVFSKDRAMQLHALVNSYFHYTINPAPLYIIYTSSNEAHNQGYEILKKELALFPVTFINETDFSKQLKEIVNKEKADRIFFMTDDGIFLERYDLNDCLLFDPLHNVFSLRMGADLDFCYTYNRKQDIPVFKEIIKNDQSFNAWLWKDMAGSPDWCYPLSVDATIFLKAEIAVILESINFKNPNSLEAEMQHYSRAFTNRNGICYSKVKYANVPCNIVQQEFKNVFTGTYSADELLKKYLNGERIKWLAVENVSAREVQQHIYSFTKIITDSRV